MGGAGPEVTCSALVYYQGCVHLEVKARGRAWMAETSLSFARFEKEYYGSRGMGEGNRLC